MLFALIFIWTPPHFWALALVKSRDYERAGVPMMPNAKGRARTRLEILVYSLLLAPLGVAPWLTGMAGAPLRRGVDRRPAPCWSASPCASTASARGRKANKAAMRLFWFTILYLFVLFGLIVVERGFGIFGRWGL